jgi:hypothetical protein
MGGSKTDRHCYGREATKQSINKVELRFQVFF